MKRFLESAPNTLNVTKTFYINDLQEIGTHKFDENDIEIKAGQYPLDSLDEDCAYYRDNDDLIFVTWSTLVELYETGFISVGIENLY